MGEVWWWTRQRSRIRSNRSIEITATRTWALIAGIVIKAMIPSAWRAGAVEIATFTTNWRRGLYYRNSIRCRNTPKVVWARWLVSPTSIATVITSRVASFTTTTAQRLWTVIVEIPFSIAAIFATSIVRVGHFGLIFTLFLPAQLEHSLCCCQSIVYGYDLL